MFDDTILHFYITLTLYLVMKNKPIFGAIALSMGMGIKGEVLLAYPAFFGWVLYQHGTVKELLSLATFFSL